MGIINRQPIHKISTDEELHSHEGFCHNIDLVIHEDGSVTPSTINFGNKGDKNITRLIFDYNILKQLDLVDQDLDEYNHFIYINDGETTVKKSPEMTEDGYSTFVMSEDLCARAISYSFIYAIEEIAPETGNVDTKLEVFISNMFGGRVANTDWDPTLEEEMDEAEELSDVLEHLSKPNITLIPSDDHYIIQASDSNLGNKKDKYMKRLTFDDRYNDLDEGLDERFAIYFQDNVLIKVVKFLPINNNELTMTSWVPEEVTDTFGDVHLIIVARTCDKAKRWVSNTLIMNVRNNFLDDNGVYEQFNVVSEEDHSYNILYVKKEEEE